MADLGFGCRSRRERGRTNKRNFGCFCLTFKKPDHSRSSAQYVLLVAVYDHTDSVEFRWVYIVDRESLAQP